MVDGTTHLAVATIRLVVTETITLVVDVIEMTIRPVGVTETIIVVIEMTIAVIIGLDAIVPTRVTALDAVCGVMIELTNSSY